MERIYFYLLLQILQISIMTRGIKLNHIKEKLTIAIYLFSSNN